MKFRQISPSGQAESIAINALLEKGRVLEYLEFKDIIGNADNWRKASAAAGGVFRALDANYGANKQTPTWAAVALKIFGDKVETDIAHERRGADVESVHMDNVLRFLRDMGAKFQYQFVNADGTDNGFTGIANLVDAGHTIDFGAADGLDISYGQEENQEILLRYMRELLAYDPDFFLADQSFISRFTNIRNKMVTINKDDLGRQIVSFGDVPLVTAGKNGLGTSAAKTLPATETVGGNADCQSVYMVKTSEIDDVAMATNTGLDLDHFGRIESDTCYRSRAEFDADVVLVEPDALWRLKGIRL